MRIPVRGSVMDRRLEKLLDYCVGLSRRAYHFEDAQKKSLAVIKSLTRERDELQRLLQASRAQDGHKVKANQPALEDVVSTGTPLAPIPKPRGPPKPLCSLAQTPAFPEPLAAHWSAPPAVPPVLANLPLLPPTPSAVEPSFNGLTSPKASEAGSVCDSLGSDWVCDFVTENLPSPNTIGDYQAQNGANGLSSVALDRLAVARYHAVAVSTLPDRVPVVAERFKRDAELFRQYQINQVVDASF